MTFASPRLIPVILLSNRKVVKTTKFTSPNYIGDPINTIQMFSDMGADEIIILDIDAKPDSKEIDVDYLRDMADKCFCPLSYGGGVKNITDAKKLVKIGFEKICVNSEALINPSFIKELSSEIGSQSVVVSVDVSGGKVHVPSRLKGEASIGVSSDPVELSRFFEDIGAGEILLGDIERDGIMEGLNLSLISEVSRSIGIPLIAVGGVGKIDDAIDGVDAGASAIAAGSLFVYSGKYKTVLINYPDQSEMKEWGFWPK